MRDAKVEDYVQGLWIQTMPDNSLHYYKPAPCLDVYTESDISPQFIDQIQDMQCANMTGEPVIIRNTERKSGGAYSWNLIIDTCEELSQYTGATNCRSDKKVSQMMNEFIVTTKTAT